MQEIISDHSLEGSETKKELDESMPDGLVDSLPVLVADKKPEKEEKVSPIEELKAEYPPV